MSTKKSQKINPLAKPNGSQTSTPTANGVDENEHLKTNAQHQQQSQQQMNPQHPQINPQATSGIPLNGMGGMQMGNNNMPMNAMNFGMNNPSFRGIPNANLHPQQLVALQAQAHYANMQQDPNRMNNPQYQQYLQQLQQQNQMYMQMQNQQLQQQQQQQQPHQNPQSAALQNQAAAQQQQQQQQQFQSQIPQQQGVPPQHFLGQQQPQQQQAGVHPFQQSQSQHPTPLQQHQPQPGRQPPQQPTPQQSHPTQHQQPTPQQAPTPQQIPQQQPPQQQVPKPEPTKVSRMPSVVQVPQQKPVAAGATIISRGPQAAAGTAGVSQQPQQIPQQPQQPGSAGGSGTVNGAPGSAGPMNPATLNIMNFRKQMSNLATLKFLDFCELIGVRSDSTKNILYWRKIITDYFSEIGVLRYSVKSGVDSRQFEFSVPIIPRFFFSIIQSGVIRMEIQPGLLRTQVLANGTTYLESSRCCFTHYYADGSYVNIHGNIRGILNQNLKLDWLDFQTHVFIPGVEWPSLEKLLSDESKVRDLFANQQNDQSSTSSSGSSKKSSADSKRLQLLTKFRSNYKVFHSMSNFGLQESVMRVMQVSDVMAHLKSLMLFSIGSETTGPLNALDAFVSQSLLANKGKNEQDPKNPAAANPSRPASNLAGKTTAGADDINSPMGSSPLTRSGKVPPLDMSQSTLTKRRRKSNLDSGLSPKSTADSPKPTTKANKKAKR